MGKYFKNRFFAFRRTIKCLPKFYEKKNPDENFLGVNIKKI